VGEQPLEWRKLLGYKYSIGVQEGVRLCDSLQTIYQDENKRSSSRRADIMDSIICIGKLSGYIEGKYVGRLGRRFTVI